MAVLNGIGAVCMAILNVCRACPLEVGLSRMLTFSTGHCGSLHSDHQLPDMREGGSEETHVSCVILPVFGYRACATGGGQHEGDRRDRVKVERA